MYSYTVLYKFIVQIHTRIYPYMCVCVCVCVGQVLLGIIHWVVGMTANYKGRRAVQRALGWIHWGIGSLAQAVVCVLLLHSPSTHLCPLLIYALYIRTSQQQSTTSRNSSLLCMQAVPTVLIGTSLLAGTQWPFWVLVGLIGALILVELLFLAHAFVRKLLRDRM